MAPNKKLSNQIKNEKKIVAMNVGSITLRPKQTRTVQLNDSSFGTIEDPPVRYERGGDRRSAKIGPPLDPTIPGDAEKIRLFEELLEKFPYMKTDVRYGIEILGEHQASRPWAGYDEQTAEEVKNTWQSMPDVARPDIKRAMKYELTRLAVDEDGDVIYDEQDEPVSATDQDKVALWDELYKAEEKRSKADSQQGVDLS